MGGQASDKHGLHSTARKQDSSRHGLDPAPAASVVTGAWGRGDRRTPLRPRRGSPIASVNPATGETIRTFARLRPAEVEARLARAAAAFPAWRGTPIAERARLLKRVADILEEERAALGRLITTEMGKLLKAAVDEVAKCARAAAPA